VDQDGLVSPLHRATRALRMKTYINAEGALVRVPQGVLPPHELRARRSRFAQYTVAGIVVVAAWALTGSRESSDNSHLIVPEVAWSREPLTHAALIARDMDFSITYSKLAPKFEGEGLSWKERLVVEATVVEGEWRLHGPDEIQGYTAPN
jgi:hypothetical protein